MEILIPALLLGLIPAFIAESKGRNFFTWYIYGVLLFIVALIHSFFLKPTEAKEVEDGMKKCPFCAEMIKQEAKVCRYCGRDLPTETPMTPIVETESNTVEETELESDTNIEGLKWYMFKMKVGKFFNNLPYYIMLAFIAGFVLLVFFIVAKL